MTSEGGEPMRLGVVVMQTRPWRQLAADFRLVEELGYDAAYVYDHLTHPTAAGGWLADGFTTLAAAAGVTDRIDLGHRVRRHFEYLAVDDRDGAERPPLDHHLTGPERGEGLPEGGRVSTGHHQPRLRFGGEHDVRRGDQPGQYRPGLRRGPQLAAVVEIEADGHAALAGDLHRVPDRVPRAVRQRRRDPGQVQYPRRPDQLLSGR